MLFFRRYKIDGGELYDVMKRMSHHPVLRPLESVYKADDPMPIPPAMNFCPYPKNFNCDPYNPYR